MNRRDRSERGKVELSKKVFEKLCKKCPRFLKYDTDWQYREEGSSLYISVRRFLPTELVSLHEILRGEGPVYRGQAAQLSAHLEAISQSDKKKISSLQILETAMIAYLKRNIIEGWLFVKDLEVDAVRPMLVDSVEYRPATGSGEGRVPACTMLQTVFWSKGSLRHHTYSWRADDLTGGKTVLELLEGEGLVKETADLVGLYLEGEKQFMLWRKMLGEQFLGRGKFEAHDDDDDDESEMHNIRLVVDDRCDDIENRRATSLFFDFGDDLEEDSDEESGGEATKKEETKKEYTRVPIREYIWCFNLETHQSGWVHMDSMKPYKYRPELRDKLILPPSHADLIDALTADMNVLMDDIVTGKSGGTSILCQGKSGTGKTLSAEIYAEVIKRPLYRVHSGQLGTEAEGVEAMLKKALNNAKRWRAVLLIDEADVFLMQRGEDLERNAVVGVFLRILEYFDGLLFLTSNRMDAIDDAILSRCIAVVKFEDPGEEERVRLWQTLGEVYKLKLVQQPKTARQLARMFTCTGRDIKGLIRLAVKYARQRKSEVTVEDIRRMSVFRGMTTNDA